MRLEHVPVTSRLGTDGARGLPRGRSGWRAHETRACIDDDAQRKEAELRVEGHEESMDSGIAVQGHRGGSRTVRSTVGFEHCRQTRRSSG